MKTTIRVNRKRPESMTKQITDQLTGLIESGAMTVGSYLPSERELANSLKVARNVVRGSYENLMKAGRIQSEGRKGRTVRASGARKRAGTAKTTKTGARRAKNKLKNSLAADLITPIPSPALLKKSMAEIRGLFSESQDFAANRFTFGQQPHEESAPHEEERQRSQAAHKLVKSLEKADCKVTRQGKRTIVTVATSPTRQLIDAPPSRRSRSAEIAASPT